MGTKRVVHNISLIHTVLFLTSCSGSMPALLRMLGSAPAAINFLRVFFCSNLEATSLCSGVEPVLLRALAFAPFSNKYLTMSAHIALGGHIIYHDI